MPARLKVVKLEEDHSLSIFILLAPEICVVRFVLNHLSLLPSTEQLPNEYVLTE